MSDLAALIDVVASMTDAADWSYGVQHTTGKRIAQELRENHGARVVDDREPMVMSLAGVRASSTGGYPGLFGNWCSAARRRLGASS